MFSNCKRWTLWTYELMNLRRYYHFFTTIFLLTVLIDDREKINAAEWNKRWKVLSQFKYWYWYRQYLIAEVLLLVITSIMTSDIRYRHTGNCVSTSSNICILQVVRTRWLTCGLHWAASARFILTLISHPKEDTTPTANPENTKIQEYQSIIA